MKKLLIIVSLICTFVLGVFLLDYANRYTYKIKPSKLIEGDDFISTDEYVFYFPKGYTSNIERGGNALYFYNENTSDSDMKSYITLEKFDSPADVFSSDKCKNRSSESYFKYSEHNGVEMCSIERSYRVTEGVFVPARAYYYRLKNSSTNYLVSISPRYYNGQDSEGFERLVSAAEKFELKN